MSGYLDTDIEVFHLHPLMLVELSWVFSLSFFVCVITEMTLPNSTQINAEFETYEEYQMLSKALFSLRLTTLLWLSIRW